MRILPDEKDERIIAAVLLFDTILTLLVVAAVVAGLTLS